MGGVSPEFTARVNELPEVEVAGGVRAGPVEVDGDPQQVLAPSREVFDILDVDPVAGSPDDLDATSTAVFDNVADDKGLSIGDRVPVDFTATGPQEMTVAMIYGDNAAAGDWLLGIDAFAADFPDQMDVQVFVKKADGV